MNLQIIPNDIIINHIIPYTYNIQSKKFLMDIKSFYIDYNIINDVYMFDYNGIILLRDLLFFTGIYEYKKLINIFKKHIFFKNYSNTQISDYIINNFELNIKINTIRKVRFLIGILTPLQRTQFINNFIIKDNI
jgi:hypothetical protein